MAIKEENGSFCFSGEDIYSYLKVKLSPDGKYYRIFCDDFFIHGSTITLEQARLFEKKEFGEVIIKPTIYSKDGKEYHGFEVFTITLIQAKAQEEHESKIAIKKLVHQLKIAQIKYQ